MIRIGYKSSLSFIRPYQIRKAQTKSQKEAQKTETEKATIREWKDKPMQSKIDMPEQKESTTQFYSPTNVETQVSIGDYVVFVIFNALEIGIIQNIDLVTRDIDVKFNLRGYEKVMAINFINVLLKLDIHEDVKDLSSIENLNTIATTKISSDNIEKLRNKFRSELFKLVDAVSVIFPSGELENFDIPPYLMKSAVLHFLVSNWVDIGMLDNQTFYFHPSEIREKYLQVDKALKDPRRIFEFSKYVIYIRSTLPKAHKLHAPENKVWKFSSQYDPSVYIEALKIYQSAKNWKPINITVFTPLFRSLFCFNHAKIGELLEVLSPSSNIYEQQIDYSWGPNWNEYSKLLTIKTEGPKNVGSIEPYKPSPEDPDHSTRRDLTYMISYAIDSITTSEVDDSIAYEKKADGTEWLYVHIADPTRLINIGSSIDNFARQRVTSIYLPDMKVLMLPSTEISSLSLVNHPEPSYALTVAFRISETGEITDIDIFPSKVLVKRLTYEVAEEAINGDLEDSEDLKKMLKFSLLREDYSQRSKKLQLSFIRGPEVSVSNGEIKLHYKKNPNANLLVQNFMIAAGEAAAQFAKANNFPIAFRWQKSMDDIPVDSELFDHPDLDIKTLRLLPYIPSADMSVEPQIHSTMGFIYSRVTSPLRRYADMITHNQLKSYLRTGSKDKLPFEKDQLEIILKIDNFISKKVRSLQKWATRYWIKKYILSKCPLEMKVKVFHTALTNSQGEVKKKIFFHSPDYDILNSIVVEKQMQIELGSTLTILCLNEHENLKFSLKE